MIEIFPRIPPMARASEEFLGDIHGMVAHGIKKLIMSGDPREMQRGIEMGLRFLKDNSITAQIEASPETQQLMAIADDTTRESLEKLMREVPVD